MDGFESRHRRAKKEGELLNESVGPTEDWERLAYKLKFGETKETAFGTLRLDVPERRVHEHATGKRADLTALECQVLWLLIRARGEGVNLFEMQEFVYRDLPKTKKRPESNVIPRIITRLRGKLSSIGSSFWIPDAERNEHISGLGLYRLELAKE